MSRLDEALSRARTFTPGEAAAAAPIDGAALDFPVEDLVEPSAEMTSVPEAVVRVEEPLPAYAANVIDARGRIEDSPIAEKLMLAGELGGHRAPVEQYRRLAARLLLAQAEHGIRSVMITSPLPGEGKTLTGANLALTLSESYKRQVLLVDADLRRPCVHQVFEVPNASGLNDGLQADNERKVPLLRFSDQLTLLTAGRPDPDPMSVLSGSRMKRVLAEARERFDWVLVDTPPITLLTDAHLMSTLVDAVVLVVRAGATPLPAIQKAVESIGQDRILGIVLNHADTSEIPETYSYYAAHTDSSGA
jgi:capsular exopolysaccharide synthesis family protein